MKIKKTYQTTSQRTSQTSRNTLQLPQNIPKTSLKLPKSLPKKPSETRNGFFQGGRDDRMPGGHRNLLNSYFTYNFPYVPPNFSDVPLKCHYAPYNVPYFSLNFPYFPNFPYFLKIKGRASASILSGRPPLMQKLKRSIYISMFN